MNFRYQACLFVPALIVVYGLSQTPAQAQFAQQGPKLIGTGAIGDAAQGWSASLSYDGNTAIVGGIGDSGIGAAWVYTRSGGVWSQQAKLVGTGNGAFSAQGVSASLSGDGNTALVGGSDDSDLMGAAWVFTRSRAGVWSQQGPKLVGTGAIGTYIEQGSSVSLSADGNTAIVGGRGDDFLGGAEPYVVGVGAAWVFTRSDGVWTQQGSNTHLING